MIQFLDQFLAGAFAFSIFCWLLRCVFWCQLRLCLVAEKMIEKGKNSLFFSLSFRCLICRYWSWLETQPVTTRRTDNTKACSIGHKERRRAWEVIGWSDHRTRRSTAQYKPSVVAKESCLVLLNPVSIFVCNLGF